MKKISLTISILLLTIGLYAQSDFRMGYIIKNNNDSISGFVRHNGNGDPKICHFRPAHGKPLEKYSPAQIKSFGIIGGYRYLSVAENQFIQDGRAANVFLTQLIHGKVSLFAYGKQFVVHKDKFYLLTRDRHSNTYYVTVLNTLLADCKLSASQLAFKNMDLRNLVRNYNNCEGNQMTEFRLRQPDILVDFDLFAAYDFSRLSTKTPNFQFHGSNAVSFGGGMNISFTKLNPRSSFAMELIYTEKNLHAFGSYKKQTRTYFEDHFISARSLRVPVGIRYDFSERTTTPYIKVGLVKYFTISNSIDLIQDIEINGAVTSAEKESVMEKTGSSGFWGSVGYTVDFFRGHRAFIEARYERSAFGALPGSGYEVQLVTTSILAGFRF